MITIRRAFAIALTILLFPVLFAALFMWRAGDTVANPGFISKELDAANVYDFVYTDIMPLAIAEARSRSSDTPIDFSKLQREIIAAIRVALPPDWLKQQTDATLAQFLPYMTGDSDHFTIHIQERSAAVAWIDRRIKLDVFDFPLKA